MHEIQFHPSVKLVKLVKLYSVATASMLEGLHGHADRVSELKQQGAFQAARDPESAITSEDAQTTAMNEAKASGAQAFVFDPNASAEDKAKQARSVSALHSTYAQAFSLTTIVTSTDHCVCSMYPPNYKVSGNTKQLH